MQQVNLYEQYRGWLHEAKQEHSDALQQERAVQESFKVDLERSQARACGLQSELESKLHVHGDLSRQVAELTADIDKRRAQEDALKVSLLTWHLQAAVWSISYACGVQARGEMLEKEIARTQEESDRNLRQMARSAEERLETCKRSHTEEMDHIHGRLKGVLQRKNETVQRLQASLDAAEARIIAYEDEARREKMHVLESMHW